MQEASINFFIFHLKEIIYNIVVFIPAGFYFTALFGKDKRLTGVFITAILSLLFEITQWIFSIGASDITDLITNTLGGVFGLFLFILLGRISCSRRMGIANLIGIVIELLGVGIFVLLLIANWFHLSSCEIPISVPDFYDAHLVRTFNYYLMVDIF